MPAAVKRATTIDCEPPNPATTMLPEASCVIAVAPLLPPVCVGVPPNCRVAKPPLPKVVSIVPLAL